MAAMPPVLAGSLVFFTSAAVLVLEILAGRLLAPYVGVSLETYTGVIGTVLAAIALGTWTGGRVADRVEPRRILGPLLVAGGALSLATIPSVRLFGAAGAGGGPQQIVLLALAGLFAPAAVLSAVTPTVVKAQLRDLAMTGRVVGWLSALGTTGAITGTFLAGFVLVAAAPTSTVILALGGTLVISGTVLWWWLSPQRGSALGAIGLVALGSAGLGVAVGDPCDVETAYHCARVVPDRSRPSGRALVLDTLRHSYVDLDDPMHLELRYTRVFADLLATAAPPDRPLDVLHVGGGGFTMPRYVAALRPGSRNLVLEIDRGLVELARQRLGLVTAPALAVRVGDARLLVGGLDGRYDVVLGDAFGGLAVPWHLTTLEFARELRRVMRPGAVYVLNLIDYPPLRFARAEVATLLAVFDHVAVIAPRGLLAGEEGGNVVVAASDQPFDAESLAARIRARGSGEEVLAGPAAVAFAGNSPVLTDDYAPVDQWLARGRAAGRR